MGTLALMATAAFAARSALQTRSISLSEASMLAERTSSATEIPVAMNELVLSQLRGQGVALFRQEVAKGMSAAAKEMEQAHMDTSVILFTMWTESIKHFAENSEGNVIFLDGSTDAMQRTMKEMMSLNLLSTDQVKGKK